MGPSIIFDKSALQALNQDEAVWFDQFFGGNITPTFYVETLADLEKEVQAGKTPEQVVGILASKTPFEAFPNVYHRTIVLQELAGDPQTLDGRPLVMAGTPKRTPDGKIAMHFDQFPEAAALSRWQQGDFEDVERDVAKRWREDLSQHDPAQQIAKVVNILPVGAHFSTLSDLKVFIDDFCHKSDKPTLQLMMDVLDVPEPGRPRVIARWEKAGKPLLDEFAPYTVHVFKVDLLYYLGMARGFIADTRASNKADMAYLYYMPFAMVFVSSDNLHQRTVPLFANDFGEEKTFITGAELKAALKEIDTHYDAMPDEIKERGVMQFVSYPPSTLDNLVTQLWDKYLRPDWRDIAREQEKELLNPAKPADKGSAAEFVEEMEQSTPIEGPSRFVPEEQLDKVYIQRFMPAHRGKWRMLSQDVVDAEKNKDEGKRN